MLILLFQPILNYQKLHGLAKHVMHLLVKDAKHIITDKSGHSIQISEPELIINAVKELIEIHKHKFK